MTNKGFLVGFLIIGLLIPVFLIGMLINDRADRKTETFKAVSSKWASGQTITGPMLIIPYTDGGARKLAYFLPESLVIKGNAQTLVPYESIYRIAVYEGDFQISGNFNPLPLGAVNIPEANLDVSKATLCMGLGDIRGLEDPIELTWDGQNLVAGAGLPLNDVLDTGMSVALPMNPGDAGKSHPFSIHMHLRGSDQLYFVPLGKSTQVSLQSDW